MTDHEDDRPAWEGVDLGQWPPDQSVRFEVAEELLGLLRGWSGEQLRRAESATRPDPAAVARLRAQHEEYLERSRQLNGQDDLGVRQVIEEYGPVARQILGRT